MQWHEALQVRGVAIGARVDDDFNQLGAPGACSVMDRPVAIVALEIDIRVRAREKLVVRRWVGQVEVISPSIHLIF